MSDETIWYKIKSSVIAWFGNIQVFKYPGFIIFGHTSYNINGTDQRGILNSLKPGDVLLRRYNNYLSSILIPGYFSHAAMYVGNNTIIHMLGKGITEEDVLTFMRCDDIRILRFTGEDEKIKNAIDCARDLYSKGIEYDYDFDFKDAHRFSCTELVHHCFGYFPLSPMKKNLIIPDDFLHTPYFEVVWSKK